MKQKLDSAKYRYEIMENFAGGILESKLVVRKVIRPNEVTQTEEAVSLKRTNEIAVAGQEGFLIQDYEGGEPWLVAAEHDAEKQRKLIISKGG